MELRINRREREDKQTIGRGFVVGNGVGFSFWTLELPWLNNQQYVSCIPAGRYKCRKRYSKKYGWHFHILGVPGRSYILIHFGNYFHDTEGCILVGMTIADIDGDGYRDVTHSKQTMMRLNEILPGEFNVVITEQISLTT